MQNYLALKIRNAFDANEIVTHKSIKASDDITAIKTWLSEFHDRPNTFTSYRQSAERFLIWCEKHNYPSLSSITIEAIQEYQLFLAQPTPPEFWCGPSKPRTSDKWKPFVKGLSLTSIALNLRILNSMYEFLTQSGYLALNPFKSRRFKGFDLKDKMIERYLTHKEWQYVINYINNLTHKNLKQSLNKARLKWIFELLYLSGCRRSEITHATMADFKQKHGNWWLCVIGKGNKYGEIPVTNELLHSLINYRTSIGLDHYPAKHETNIALVNNLTNTPSELRGLTDSMLYKLIKNTCLKIANDIRQIDPSSAYVIEKVSTHWLRHTSATHQVDAGIDIRVVKENLRHSMLETTMKYQHTEASKRHSETNTKFGIDTSSLDQKDKDSKPR